MSRFYKNLSITTRKNCSSKYDISVVILKLKILPCHEYRHILYHFISFYFILLQKKIHINFVLMHSVYMCFFSCDYIELIYSMPVILHCIQKLKKTWVESFLFTYICIATLPIFATKKTNLSHTLIFAYLLNDNISIWFQYSVNLI